MMKRAPVACEGMASDTANIVRVARFAAAPQRVQQLNPHMTIADNVIVPAFGGDFRRMFVCARAARPTAALLPSVDAIPQMPVPTASPDR
ncbi:MAG: hypothetical protein GC182_08680 [Rhodopseudomonas sp.]|nr:hypothetical protein [Rhodopseudomonas sp.]